MKKIIYSLIILILILGTIGTQVYATQTHKAGEIIREGDEFIDKGQNGSNPIKETDLKNMSDTIYNILLIGGMIIAFIVGAILGIKFILGGIEEQVEVKKMLVPYIAGCVIIFGAFTIWKIVLTILQA